MIAEVGSRSLLAATRGSLLLTTPTQTFAMRPLASLLLIGLSASSALAQSIGGHLVMTEIGSGDLGRPLGFGFGVEPPIAGTGIRWHLSFEAIQGSHRRTGSPCVGLIPAGSATCRVQRLRTVTDMESALLGLRVPLLRTRRGSLSLVGDLGIARAATKTRDSADVVRFKAWRMVYRPQIGAEARWKPRARRALSLSGGVAIGQLRPVRNMVVADGYGPFDAAVQTKRAWLGLMFALDPASASRRRR